MCFGLRDLANQWFFNHLCVFTFVAQTFNIGGVAEITFGQGLHARRKSTVLRICRLNRGS